ncbi:hypothetical protein X737_15995 [Mesorhizobium sp. L48C026A00]|nr:hypothetical protein X737_15995 [Mesorhizobium sp. L48C026A00]
MRELRSSDTSADDVIKADLMMVFIGPVLAGEAPKGRFD